ncbi:MAG TPA: tetratricopeptide repeat protein [Gemmatimonadaceae bacterium]|nr:tetratricopeptide repeat protein [Gemmatimonadaceae bacterium]
MSRPSFRRRSVLASTSLAVVVFAFAAHTVRAQQLTLKRSVPSDSGAPCPQLAKPVIPSWAQREQARRIMVLGHEAAITGDYAAARDHFKQAAQLDPTDENIAYELARAYEGTKDTADAAAEYCRYLSLAPTSTEAVDVRAHIASLTAGRDPKIPAQAAARFRTGVEAFDHQQWSAADRAFSAAMTIAPAWPDPYYDRALARSAAGDARHAIDDFVHYLRLAPNAEDRSAVAAHLVDLRRGLLNPSVALASGIIPGAGQFYTHRPVLGFVVLGAAAGALYWGFHPQHVTITRQAEDPNHVPYTYTLQGTQRTHLTAGVATATAITLLGALEAYVYARRDVAPAVARGAQQRAHPAVSSFAALPVLTPSGMGMGFTVRLPLRFH